MNEFESALVDRVLDGIQSLELKVVESVGALKGEIKSLGEKGSAEHAALKETVERNISQDTERLNKHSQEIDDLQSDMAAVKEWKDGVIRSMTNRTVVIGGAMAILAVIIAFILDKF